MVFAWQRRKQNCNLCWMPGTYLRFAFRAQRCLLNDFVSNFWSEQIYVHTFVLCLQICCFSKIVLFWSTARRLIYSIFFCQVSSRFESLISIVAKKHKSLDRDGQVRWSKLDVLSTDAAVSSPLRSINILQVYEISSYSETKAARYVRFVNISGWGINFLKLYKSKLLKWLLSYQFSHYA